MYQRYYKQKRFGKILSFVLVVGSGLGHYVKSSYKFVKEMIKIENLVKYTDYFPENLSLSLNKEKLFKNENFEFEKKFWIYENNIKNLKKKEFVINNSEEDVKNLETYYLYKKYKINV
jgi:hypothetical protein